MSTIERHGSHQIIRNRQGVQATIEWVCSWSDRTSVRPKIGAAHPTERGLYCTEVIEEGVGKPTGSGTYEYCKITATYSTFQQIDAAPQESWEFGGEVLETGLGRLWWGAQTYCEQSFGVYYPNAIRTLTVVRNDIPIIPILNALGKVNWTTFMGIPAEQMLFEGATTESWYDYERNRYFYRCSYRFLVRPISHNMVWRAPRQARDETGQLIFDNDGNPVFVDGPAGVGGWDRPYPNLYELGDFNPLFGLPANPPQNPYQPASKTGAYSPTDKGGR